MPNANFEPDKKNQEEWTAKILAHTKKKLFETAWKCAHTRNHIDDANRKKFEATAKILETKAHTFENDTVNLRSNSLFLRLIYLERNTQFK